MRPYPYSRRSTRAVVVAFAAALTLAVLEAGSATAAQPTFARTVSCSATTGETTVTWTGPHFRSLVIKYYSLPNGQGTVLRSDFFIVSGTDSFTDPFTPPYAVSATAFFQRHNVVDEVTAACT